MEKQSLPVREFLYLLNSLKCTYVHAGNAEMTLTCQMFGAVFIQVFPLRESSLSGRGAERLAPNAANEAAVAKLGCFSETTARRVALRVGWCHASLAGGNPEHKSVNSAAKVWRSSSPKQGRGETWMQEVSASGPKWVEPTRRVVHIAAPQGAHTGDTQWKAQSMSANGKDIKKQTTALTAMGTHDTMTVHKAKNMVPHNENKMLLRMVTKRKKWKIEKKWGWENVEKKMWRTNKGKWMKNDVKKWKMYSTMEFINFVHILLIWILGDRAWS